MAEKTKIPSERIEREYIIPLRHRWKIVPRYKRTPKAVKAIKEFLVRHMKIRDRDLDKIKIDKYLNEVIWARGIRSPPSKIKVRAIKEGDIVRVTAVDMPNSIKFKKIRKEKVESKGKEIAKKKKEEKAVETEKPVVEGNAEKKEEEKKEDGKQEISHSSVEAKREEKENKAAVVEAGQEIEKTVAKQEKHTTKVQSPKQEKNLRTGYNQAGRGH
jgi:large subunit ribosomal protein L31e